MTKVNNLVQGTDEWLAHRESQLNASEASAMLGISPYMSRGELLRQKATGVRTEIDARTRRLFDDGHKLEELARPWAEGIIAEELFPATLSKEIDGLPLSASLDGMDMSCSVTWEHKSLNAKLRKSLPAGVIPDEYKPQMEQGLMISGADKCLFMASSGDKEEMLYAWYKSDAVLRDALIAGWKQFTEDLKSYQPEVTGPELVGVSPDTLPALRIELTGMVTASNLTEFKSTAMSVIDSVNTDLQTDADFADAEKAVKWCSEVETKLSAAKDHALNQTSSIDELFRALDEIKETARTKRLNLEKLVKARKQAVRDEILMAGRKAYTDHIDSLNATLGGKIRLPDIAADFAGVMKGKRTVTSLRDAVNTELARVKIESNQVADKIRLNLETLRLDAAGYEHLFADAQQLVLKEKDDLKNLIKARIAEHKEAEEKRLEAEREKIREEEAAKLKAEEAMLTEEKHANGDEVQTIFTDKPITDDEFTWLASNEAKKRGLVKRFAVTVTSELSGEVICNCLRHALLSSGSFNAVSVKEEM